MTEEPTAAVLPHVSPSVPATVQVAVALTWGLSVTTALGVLAFAVVLAPLARGVAEAFRPHDAAQLLGWAAGAGASVLVVCAVAVAAAWGSWCGHRLAQVVLVVLAAGATVVGAYAALALTPSCLLLAAGGATVAGLMVTPDARAWCGRRTPQR